MSQWRRPALDTYKSNPNVRIDVSTEREEKSPVNRGKLPSIMNTVAHIMQCLTLYEQRSIEWTFRKVTWAIHLKHCRLYYQRPSIK